MPLLLLSLLPKLKRLWAVLTNKYVLIAIAVAAVLTATYLRGRSDGRAACESAHQAAITVKVDQEKASDAKAVKASDKRTTAASAQDRKNRGIVSHVVSELKAPVTVEPAAAPADEGVPVDAVAGVCIPAGVADELRSIH